MENERCCKCGREHPEYTYRFVAVDQSSTSSTAYQGTKQVTTTTTTEQFKGVDRASFCIDCIKKKRITNAITTSLGVLAAGFIFSFILIAFCVSKAKNANGGLMALASLGVGVVAGIIAFIVCMIKENPFVAGEILSKIRKNTSFGQTGANIGSNTSKTMRYVPVDSGFYIAKNASQPDLQTFQNKSGLKTNVGVYVFTLFIAPGNGNGLVDLMIEKGVQPENGQITNGIPTAPVTETTVTSPSSGVTTRVSPDKEQQTPAAKTVPDPETPIILVDEIPQSVKSVWKELKDMGFAVSVEDVYMSVQAKRNEFAAKRIAYFGSDFELALGTLVLKELPEPYEGYAKEIVNIFSKPLDKNTYQSKLRKIGEKIDHNHKQVLVVKRAEVLCRNLAVSGNRNAGNFSISTMEYAWAGLGGWMP